jgi:hypothetical protein
MSIESLSEEIYENYGTTNKSGIDYFSDYMDDLQNFDFQDVFTYQMTKFDLQYCLDFILSCPKLWSDLPPSQWLEILEKADRQELKELDDSGEYADIVFMCKYLGLDAISLICSSGAVLPEVKVNVLKYVEKHAHRFELDDIDEEDLDDEYFVSSKKLTEVRKGLVQSGVFKEFNSIESILLQNVR